MSRRAPGSSGVKLSVALMTTPARTRPAAVTSLRSAISSTGVFS